MEKHIDTQEPASGKHVSGPIRPWLETSLLFQHFEINDQSDVTDLQWHCQFVYLDIDPTGYFLQG